MKKLITALLITGLFLFAVNEPVMAQGSESYEGGMKVKLNPDGSKYFRILTWHQMWLKVDKPAEQNLAFTPMLRRSRLLIYSQISGRFLILSHIGLNSLTAQNMHPTGMGNGPELFVHDAWAEYTVIKDYLYMGGGLHYWNGISRSTNMSTLNIMTLDAPRFNWPSLGLSDQFARHLGIYAKGKIGKLDYRIAANDALRNTLDKDLDLRVNQALYQNEGGWLYSGYFMYQFFDQESNLLPYLVGTYLGTKRVFNIGAGFQYHPDGTTSLLEDSTRVTHNVMLLGVDVFYDAPIGNSQSITFYGVYHNYDFGPNYLLQGKGDVIGTEWILCGQLGWLLPKFSEKLRLQPYAAYSHRSLEAYDDPAGTMGLGANLFIDGHNAKVTLEYRRNWSPINVNTGALTLQGMIYL